jgi:hypothetical protein
MVIGQTGANVEKNKTTYIGWYRYSMVILGDKQAQTFLALHCWHAILGLRQSISYSSRETLHSDTATASFRAVVLLFSFCNFRPSNS